MNRIDLQRLAHTRVADAQALLQEARWAAAYYLLGYAVECAIKACIARQFHQDEVPDRTVVNDFYTHRLDQLLRISGVGPALETRAAEDLAFRIAWRTVRDWNEGARYNLSITEDAARDMFRAVAGPESGVLRWLSTQW